MKIEKLAIPGVVIELPKSGTLLVRGAATPELSAYLGGFIPAEEMADYVHPAYGEISVEVRMDPALVKGSEDLVGKRNVVFVEADVLVTSFTGSKERGADEIKSFVQLEVTAAKAVQRFDATEYPHTIRRRVTEWSRNTGSTVPAGTIAGAGSNRTMAALTAAAKE